MGHGVAPTMRVVLQPAVLVRVMTLPWGVVKPGGHCEAGGAHVNMGHWILDVTLVGGSVAGAHVAGGIPGAVVLGTARTPLDRYRRQQSGCVAFAVWGRTAVEWRTSSKWPSRP